ncbi:hypothetical protein GCM10022408_33810 [Hymenobacter fastidiosus]|uniref:Glycosyltransferase RgtA/B/C/D-like domain-containing protein n=1 Tax=Hymenobacter fastidiosus TaxID=486264 RepID=A0ABP7SWU8_9BACT
MYSRFKQFSGRWAGLTRPRFFWFWITTLLFGTHLLTSAAHPQVYDANGYWELTYKLYNGGNFSLYNFDSALRGYLFPLLHVPVLLLGQAQPFLSIDTIIKLIGAALAGALFGVLLPRLWLTLTGQPVSAGRQLLLVGLTFALWRDYFHYTLTDFPVLAGEVAVLLLLLQRLTPGRVLLAGLLSAALINVRPVYLVVVPVLGLLLLWVSTAGLRQWRWQTGQWGLLFALGFALVTLPQWLINQHNFNSSRPLVIGIDLNDPVMSAKGDLYLQKLSEGLQYQKYETTIGDDYAKPQVLYRDPVGVALLAADFNHEIESYGEYLTLAAAHPLDLATLYLRHLFNGLDVLYSTPYLRHVYRSSVGLAWLNYTMLFAALAVVLRHLQRLRALHWLLVVALLAPVALSVPLSVECRYVLPLHLMLVTVACFGWPGAWTWTGLAGRRLTMTILYAAFVLVCFTLSSSTQILLDLSPKLLNP